MFPRRLVLPLLAALTLGACAYPNYATGRAPAYDAGYQPVMGGQAVFWPQQPGALWGPEDVPGIDVFFQPLSAHGRWAPSRWGQVFIPAAPAGWRPYQNGQWLENRFWLSADPWGWATDHYGRWGFDDQLGWVWVPGTQWGPSWVAWRESDEVVGWAPIPPQVQWNVGLGFGSGWGFDNWNSWYGPSWAWVPRSNLFLPGFGGGLLPWNAGLTWWGRSRWQHSPYWGWNQPWDRGWGWQAPAWAWNGWAGQYPGWSNWGWNRPGWNRPGWNRPGWNDRWNDRWDRGPRRGAPGSVGDRIGRDLAGQPPQPQPGWQQPGWQQGREGRQRGWNRGGRSPDGQYGTLPPGGPGNRPEWRGDGPARGSPNRQGQGGGQGWGRNPNAAPPTGMPNSVSGAVGGAMAGTPPPRPQGSWGGNRGNPAAQSAPQPSYRPPPAYRPPPPPPPPPPQPSVRTVEPPGAERNPH